MTTTYVVPADDFATSNQFIMITDPPPSYAESVRRAKRSRDRASIAPSEDFPVPGSSEGIQVMTERSYLLPTSAESEAPLELTLFQKLGEYFRPLGRREYWLPIVHLLIVNFPFTLIAWLYLFLGVLVGTTLLLTLPLGALIWWLTLIGSRYFANVEIRLQCYFHDIQYTSAQRAIFYQPSSEIDPESGVPIQHTFLQNSYAMFLDWEGSYIPIFHFLVVKAAITLVLTILAIVVIPPGIIFVIPAPYILRLFRRVGRWQAHVALEGLSR